MLNEIMEKLSSKLSKEEVEINNYVYDDNSKYMYSS